MTVVQGNILDITEGVIVHQVNCKKVMGAGLAKQIRAKYPQHYEDFMKTAPVMGDIVKSEITPDKLYIVGCYGQDGYGTDKQYTDHLALYGGLIKAAKLAQKKGLTLYAPYKLGCGLAGGDWEVVKGLLERVTYYAPVVIVKFD